MSKVRLTATIACFQIRKKWSKKPLVYRPCILAFLPNSARNFFVCKQQRRRSASAPAQFYQLSLESMIAKPATCKKIKFLSDMRARIQPIPTEGGGGRIASRGRFVPVFSLGNKWQLMIFIGRSGPPAPSVSAHIRVSNSLNSHFIYFLLGLVNSQNVC